ncbi:MAG: 3-phosphoshikimate 1-carboxyvinyltransferase [Polyangiaceae bacterium]
MSRFRVRPAARPLTGSVPIVSDKSIGHRALMLGAICGGESTVTGFSYGADNVSTLEALRALGVQVEDDGRGQLRIAGVGLRGFTAPAGVIDCGNSGTTMRLLAGLLAGQPFATTLTGDESLSRRPMRRIAEPLARRGARVQGGAGKSDGELTPPLTVGPLPSGRLLEPLDYESPVASAQVKSAVLLSGLYASGPTRFREPLISRDHTERMLSALGVPLHSAGPMLELHPPRDPMSLRPFQIVLPGDLSAAAFVLVAAALVPESHVTVRGVGVNPTRSGALDALRAFGLPLSVAPRADALGEPVADLTLCAGALGAARVAGELALRAIDEIPILCALAAFASGVTEFADLRELRVKESDRIAAMSAVMRAFGVEVEERPDGLLVEGSGGRQLRAARVASGGDHRIAMSAAVLALVSDGECVIDDVDCVGTSFPRFAGTLRALGAEVEVES